MNRLLVLLAITTLAIAGCATDVDDPLPQPPTPQEPRRPQQPLAGDPHDPFAYIAGPLHIQLPPEEAPLLEKPPIPTN